jgi:plastocyanin
MLPGSRLRVEDPNGKGSRSFHFLCAGLLAGFLSLVVLPIPSVASPTKQVAVGDNFYKPRSLSVRVGDAVHWASTRNSFDLHNVRQDRRVFTSGQPSSTVNFTRRFSAGSFHYYCTLHGSASGGMEGTVRVPVTIDAAPQGLPFTVQWGSKATNTGAEFDVRYRIGTGRWRKWTENTTAFQRAFGKLRKPVKLIAGRTYSFKARSQKSSQQQSRWSPVRSFTP